MICSDAPPTHARFRYDRQLRSPQGPHCHTAGSYASRDGDAGKVPGKLPYCGHVLADGLRFIPRSARPSIRPSRSVTEVTGCTAGFPRMLRSPARRTSIPCRLPRSQINFEARPWMRSVAPSPVRALRPAMSLWGWSRNGGARMSTDRPPSRENNCGRSSVSRVGLQRCGGSNHGYGVVRKITSSPGTNGGYP